MALKAPSLDFNNFKKLKLIKKFKYYHTNTVFGEVDKIQDKKTGNIFLAYISHPEESKKDSKSLKRVIDILSNLQEHQAILNFIGYSKFVQNNKTHTAIITDYCPNGTLKDIIQAERNGHPFQGWDDTKKLITIYGIASGMAYLHSKGILHRNLKPVTIFMDGSLYPKIHGFNLLIKCDDELVDKPIKNEPEYIAPEIIMREASAKPMDVYSFAMIVYEIVTLEHPFDEIENLNIIHILQKVNNNEMPTFKKSIPKSYQNLIQRCWAKNPDDRPTFDEIVHLLKTDQGFITNNVRKEEYQNYIRLIDHQNYTSTHDENDKDIINLLSKNDEKNSQEQKILRKIKSQGL